MQDVSGNGNSRQGCCDKRCDGREKETPMILVFEWNFIWILRWHQRRGCFFQKSFFFKSPEKEFSIYSAPTKTVFFVFTICSFSSCLSSPRTTPLIFIMILKMKADQLLLSVYYYYYSVSSLFDFSHESFSWKSKRADAFLFSFLKQNWATGKVQWEPHPKIPCLLPEENKDLEEGSVTWNSVTWKRDAKYFSFWTLMKKKKALLVYCTHILFLSFLSSSSLFFSLSSLFLLSPTTTIQTIIQQSITYTENLVFLTHLSLPLFLFCTKFNWTKTGRENQSIRRRSLYQRSRWILYPRRGPHSLWNEHHEGSSLPKTVDSLCFPKETCCSSCSSNSSCDSFNCYWQRCNEKKDPGL